MKHRSDNIYAIILAAGASTRFGSPKQLAHWQNKTLLQHTLNLVQSLVSEKIIVVLGANAEQIKQTIDQQSVSVIENSNWKEGLSTSIKAGVNSLPDSARATLILLCDQPLLKTDSLKQLIEAWQMQPESIVASDYKNTAGVPAIFPASMYAKLKTLSGDKGAKQLLASLKDKVLTVPMPEAGQDIDTKEDFEQLIMQNTNQELCYD